MSSGLNDKQASGWNPGAEATDCVHLSVCPYSRVKHIAHLSIHIQFESIDMLSLTPPLSLSLWLSLSPSLSLTLSHTLTLQPY